MFILKDSYTMNNLQQQKILKLELFKQSIQYIEYNFIQRNLSMIWIIKDKNNKKYIEKDYDNNIQINVGNLTGKKLLVKFICFISIRNKSYPVYFILKNYNINIRKIVFSYMTTEKNKEKIFKYMMTFFIILTENLYNRYTVNNKFSLVI